ncbi:putative alpha-N-arabinofuranosidase 2 [Thozetella sp. PMI_491]|nr:putative alpha-N-arabinofuranosidase 2 [Thozetella sp. PMI_491]
MRFSLLQFRRGSAAIFLALVGVLCVFVGSAAAVSINHGADPSIMKVGDTYYSAASDGGAIYVRAASSIVGLATASDHKIWTDTAGHGSVWAPEITTDGGTTYIYFSAGNDAAHRMYVISAGSPLGPFSVEQKLALPDDRWAIDGTMFTFEGQRYFVWSGWEGTENVEQTLYICRMAGPLSPTGPRYVISQPRESWEQGDHPLINEGPEAIVDPDGQLHIVYSANGSWDKRYCLADLRLRKGGDPTYVWDWYKSNGCLFGSEQDRLMAGWDATLWIDGPGHHTFVLPDGNVNESPGGVNHIPFVFHGVRKGTPYSWGAREWFTGSFVWWSKTTYSRANVPGDNQNTGFSFKFFEDPI